MSLQVMKLNENAIIPTKGSVDSAGVDLYHYQDDVTIQPGNKFLFHTGLAVKINAKSQVMFDLLGLSFYGRVAPRSGLSVKKTNHTNVLAGVIDRDYRGELIVALANYSDTPITIKSGDRVAQLIVTPYLTTDIVGVNSLDETTRGVGGFGSTGD